jgi:hypothetical protein
MKREGGWECEKLMAVSARETCGPLAPRLVRAVNMPGVQKGDKPMRNTWTVGVVRCMQMWMRSTTSTRTHMYHGSSFIVYHRSKDGGGNILAIYFNRVKYSMGSVGAGARCMLHGGSLTLLVHKDPQSKIWIEILSCT